MGSKSRKSNAGKAAPKRKAPTVSKTRGKKANEEKPVDEKKPRTCRPKKSLPTDVDLMAHIPEQRELSDWLLDKNIDYRLPMNEFKVQCRAALTQFEYFRHNIYWTRHSCGLTMWDGEGKKTEAATFAFADHPSSTVVSIACAELFVT